MARSPVKKNPSFVADLPEDSLSSGGALIETSSREQRIRERAYERFISRPAGAVVDPIQDWLDAEADIDAQTPPAAE